MRCIRKTHFPLCIPCRREKILRSRKWSCAFWCVVSFGLHMICLIERKGTKLKRTLSLLLVFVMLLSLCACSNSDHQTTDPSNSSQATTEGNEKPTDSTERTTGTTQAPTDEPTDAPTDEPTTAPTTETPTTTPPTACSHSYKDATCTAPKTCSKCGATEGGLAEHRYQNGICTGCGEVEIITHSFETGTGYAITVSSDEVICYQISASELLYDLCTTEKPAQGYFKFRENNGTTYYSPAPSWGWLTISSYTISGRTVQLKFESETMELELVAANQYKVTKGVESVPAGIVFTFETDMCSFVGHLYERSCENDVTCMYCGHVKCAGLGHEYGEDGVCFRCYAAMRPSDSGK